jgi:AcrR family transcriptional regulator
MRGMVVRRSRLERERVVLDTAARLFYARGVHAVGMDELVEATGLGKATVYRLYPSKDALVGGYLRRLAEEILGAIDREAHAAPDAVTALHGLLDAVAADLRRPGYRGCAFHNAGSEFDDPAHPARVVAREYRAALLARLTALVERAAGCARPEPAGQLAALIDGAYTSAAHLGPDGPAAAALRLARALVDGLEGG